MGVDTHISTLPVNRMVAKRKSPTTKVTESARKKKVSTDTPVKKVETAIEGKKERKTTTGDELLKKKKKAVEVEGFSDDDDDEVDSDATTDSDDDVGKLLGGKMRYRLREMDENEELVNDSGKGEEDSEIESEPYGTKIGGISVRRFADVLPIKGDEDGKFGYRCKYCAEKLLISDSDVVFHLQSSLHKKMFKKHKKLNMTQEQIKGLKEKARRKKQRRAEKGKPDKKEKKKLGKETKTPEQIANLKLKNERRAAKKLLKKENSKV